MTMAKIMIVEDESLVGLDIQNNLEDMGFTVTSVHAEAHTALSAIPLEHPDLVLMDIQLRGTMDGIDAARKVSDDFEIPVLFLTAFSDKEILERARVVGAFGYMVKPFTSRELRAMVEISLSKHCIDKEKKQLDERISRANKNDSLRIMAGGLAHRLNNSLQVVMGNLSLVNAARGPLEADDCVLADAKKAAENAAELGRQLLACSGHGFLHSEAVDLNSVIQAMVASLEQMMPEGVSLVLEPTEIIPAIQADAAQLEQVIFTLVTNAIEAVTPGPGTITIATMAQECRNDYLKNVRIGKFLEEGKYVCFSVTDTGCGMDDGTMQKMFDPFFSTKFPGRGLGLAASLGIVQAHRGTVDVSSTQGAGSTVKVLFPVFVDHGISQ